MICMQCYALNGRSCSRVLIAAFPNTEAVKFFSILKFKVRVIRFFFINLQVSHY